VCEWVEVLTDGNKLGRHLPLLPPGAQNYMQYAAHLSEALAAVFRGGNGGLSAEKSEATCKFA
jgi:hypothetical protein